jgi:hypothetical protein
VVKARFSVVDGGSKWRRLPQEYPTWPRGYWSCRPWRASGDWHRRHDTLRAQGRHQAGHHQPPTASGLESHSVQTTAWGGERGDDTGTNVQGRQRPMLVETWGLLRAVRVTAAAVSDPAGARRLWGDGRDRGQWVEWVAQHRRFVLRPVVRPEEGKGVVRLPRRWGVERTLA